MYDFTYRRAASLADAVAMLKADPEAKPVAGGMTLVPTIKQRLARPSMLVDLGGIPGLAGIEVAGGALKIGAMTTHVTVARSEAVRKAIPALSVLAEGIGDPAVRNCGTIGGSISNNDPAADYPAAVLGLGATVHTDRRQIAADSFFTGLFGTALEPGEIVTAVSFPVPEKAAYAKFPQPSSRYALAGVFVSRGAGGVRVAVTGAGPCVFRHKAAEAALAKSWTAAALESVALPAGGLNGDIHATPEYRAHLVGVMAQRAVAAAG